MGDAANVGRYEPDPHLSRVDPHGLEDTEQLVHVTVSGFDYAISNSHELLWVSCEKFPVMFLPKRRAAFRFL